MFRNTARCLGRRTEFLKRLELMTDAIESKELRRRHWAKVYTDTCTMSMAGGQVDGLEAIISPLPAFNHAFDVTPKIVEVVGDEDAEKFTVHYKHAARFVGPYGVVQVSLQTRPLPLFLSISLLLIPVLSSVPPPPNTRNRDHSRPDKPAHSRESTSTP